MDLFLRNVFSRMFSNGHQEFYKKGVGSRTWCQLEKTV